MAYAQIHVQAPRHPKLLPLSDAAWRLWVTGLCYVQEHLTDGHIPKSAIRTFGLARPELHAKSLVKHGLWTPVLGGFSVHDYADWNHTREEVSARQTKRRDRWNRWKAKVSAKDAPTNADANASQTPTQTRLHRVSGASLSPPQPQPQPQPQYVQDQDPAAGAAVALCGNVENSGRRHPRSPDTPSVKHLTRVAAELLRQTDYSTDADLKQDLKQRCAELHLAYSADAVRKALDGARALLARETKGA